jgi:hypothetical protein
MAGSGAARYDSGGRKEAGGANGGNGRLVGGANDYHRTQLK